MIFLNASDQAQVRAGVQVKEEKEMVGMENTGKLQLRQIIRQVRLTCTQLK